MTLVKEALARNRTYQVCVNKITVLAEDNSTVLTMPTSSNPSTPGKRKASTPVLAPLEEWSADSPSKKSKKKTTHINDFDNAIMLSSPGKSDMDTSVSLQVHQKTHGTYQSK
jgi:hypothetical protein